MSFHTEAQLKLALDDIRQGITRSDLWLLLGWQDIRQKFRRSLLGPFWLTISTAIMLVALGFLYAALFKMDLNQYFPYLAAGIVTWSLVAGLVIEGCQTFIGSEAMIKQIRLPFTVHALRVVWRNILVFVHNVVIVVAVVLILAKWPSAISLLCLLAGMALIMLNGAWVCLLLGLICTRYRDMPPMVASLIQLVFFVTPIIWHPSLLAGRQRIINFNPFYHFIELLRAPMLDTIPAAITWAAVLGITAVGWLVTVLVFWRYRRRIAYWI
jgi:ABC-type polysaccharide/polyol phosphate export permease